MQIIFASFYMVLFYFYKQALANWKNQLDQQGGQADAGKTTQNQLSWVDFLFWVWSWFLCLVELDSIAAASYISIALLLIIFDKITQT